MRMQSRSPDAASIAAELGHDLIIGLRVRRFLKSPSQNLSLSLLRSSAIFTRSWYRHA